jgi:hypothetical protein
MSRTKLSLAGNNSIIPGQKSLVSDIPARDRKMYNIFLQCILVQGTGGSFQHQGRLVPLQAKEQRLQHCSMFHRKKLAPKHSNLALVKNV